MDLLKSEIKALQTTIGQKLSPCQLNSFNLDACKLKKSISELKNDFQSPIKYTSFVIWLFYCNPFYFSKTKSSIAARACYDIGNFNAFLVLHCASKRINI